jgi:ribose 5-phosphate isomerase B
MSGPMRLLVGGDEYEPVIDLIAAELRALGHDVVVVGAKPGAPTPWAHVALEIARAVASGAVDQGVVCCYSGTGVCMAANKVDGVRAALCVDAETAKAARQWNDANVLALSLRLLSATVAKEIVRAWSSSVYGGTETASLEIISRAESGNR